jgi:hypothetical protein
VHRLAHSMHTAASSARARLELSEPVSSPLAGDPRETDAVGNELSPATDDSWPMALMCEYPSSAVE